MADRLPCAGLACNDRRVHLLLLAQSAGAADLPGRWPAPPWAIALVGVVVAALAVVFLVLRARRAKKPASAGLHQGKPGSDLEQDGPPPDQRDVLGVAVYGGFVLYRGVGRIAHEFGHYAWWTFAAACALAFSNYLLRFLKWEYYLGVLGIRGVPKGESLLIFLSGFVLTVTPGKVGEVFKSLILKEIRGVPIERTAPIVVAERVTDLIGVITLIAIGSLSLPGGMVWASAGAILVAALLVFVPSPALSARLLHLLPRLPGALGRVFGRIAPKVEEALLRLR